MSAATVPVLGYWQIRGLAQPIRLLLEYTGQAYAEDRYEVHEDWFPKKHSLGLQFPNLPYWIEPDGLKLTQSSAILRHIARSHKLDGETAQQKALVDMVLEEAIDIKAQFARLAYSPEFESKRDSFVNDYLPPKIAALAEFLGSNDWFCGSLTVADFMMYELLDVLHILDHGCLDKTPLLKFFLARFEALPSIKRYLKSDRYIGRPINFKSASFR